MDLKNPLRFSTVPLRSKESAEVVSIRESLSKSYCRRSQGVIQMKNSGESSISMPAYNFAYSIAILHGRH